jgi:hypothetical protein
VDSRRQYANVLPRLLKLTRKKLALKVASSTMMCSVRLGRDWHYLRLNEVIICQEHVVLCIPLKREIYVRGTGMLLHINGKLNASLFFIKASYLSDWHFKFLGVVLSIKHA